MSDETNLTPAETSAPPVVYPFVIILVPGKTPSEELEAHVAVSNPDLSDQVGVMVTTRDQLTKLSLDPSTQVVGVISAEGFSDFLLDGVREALKIHKNVPVITFKDEGDWRSWLHHVNRVVVEYGKRYFTVIHEMRNFIGGVQKSHDAINQRVV
jgi:hypothetical protein